MTREEALAQGKKDADAYLKGIYVPMLTKRISRVISTNKDHIKQLESENRQHEKNMSNVEFL